MLFDARAAKALKSGSHIVVHGCPGLRLIASNTLKTWTYRYKSPTDGRMRQVRIGHWPEMPPATAVARWQELREKRGEGDDVVLTRRAKRAEESAATEAVYTLGNLVADYATLHLDKRREPAGARAVRRRLELAIGGRASTPVDKVNRRMVFDLLDGLSDTPVLANSVRSEMAAAWDLGLNSGRVPESLPNWWRLGAGQKLRSKGAVRDGEHRGTAKRVLSEAEIATLFGHDLQLFSQQMQDFLTLQMWTCTRGGEIVQMRPEHITQEDDGWWWVIPKGSNKLRHVTGATDQRVPLVGRALAVVQRLMVSGGWLFPSVSRTGVVGHVAQASMQSKVHYFQPYSRSRPDHERTRLTVTHWSPHDLRRTGRTMLAAMRCPHDVGEAILGHVVGGVAGVYQQYRFDRERREWLTLLSDKLEAIIVA